MKLLATATALTAAAFATLANAAAHLPDLGAREVTVVTENAYPPLQFIDASGNRGRLGI